MNKVKDIKVLILLLLLVILVGCENTEWTLGKEEYKGKKLAVIVKTDNKSKGLKNGLGIEVEGFGEKLSTKELSRLNNFFRRELENHTDMTIISKQDILNEGKDYDVESIQQILENKSDLDLLLVVNLSNIVFTNTEKVLARDSTIEKDDINYFRNENKENYESMCSVKVSYQIIDLSQNKAIYSKEGTGQYTYKGDEYYHKIILLEKAILKAIDFKI